jgi:pimeloyl-ACP methyl ester carboxylesterase
VTGPVANVGADHPSATAAGSDVREIDISTDDGVRLAARVAGAGPPVILVHGFGGLQDDFGDHVDALASRATVVTFDHRGHGASAHPEDPGAYSLERLALDVLQVADALSFDRFRLLGHSMGGMVVQRVVLRAGDRVEALVLMNTAPGAPSSLDRDLVAAGAEIARTEGMAALKEVMDVARPLGTPAHERLLEQRPGYREFCDAKTLGVSPIMWSTLATEIIEQPDLLDALGSIGCPTLVIIGNEDETFLEASVAMADAIPGSSLVVIPDAGHSPQFENPGAWRSALEEFLAQLEHDAVR